jgi:excisionase family DNA binding protein
MGHNNPPEPMEREQPKIDLENISIAALAYPPAVAAKVVGRSYTRIKKAIREKELTACKDGRATLIAHAELQRWLASLPTIGREPEQEAAQEPAHVAASVSAGGRHAHAQAHARPTPPPRPRSLAMSNALQEALEDTPRR